MIRRNVQFWNKTIGTTVFVVLFFFLLPVFGGLQASAEDKVGKLIRKLEDKHPKARAGAARELGNLGDARAVGPLINVMKDTDSYVRGQAARSLGKLKAAQAVDPLIKALKDDFTYVREEAARSLGEIKDARAAGPLINFLKDDPTYAREEAIKALIKMGPNAIAPLANAVKENNLRVVADSYSFFVCRGETGTEALLIDALNKYGSEKMSEDFAYSGNDRLKEAAYKWAETHLYKIKGLLGLGNSPVWGKCAADSA